MTQNICIQDRNVAFGPDGKLIRSWRPLIWSAIIGGTVVALGLQSILTFLGVGLGMAMIEAPASDPHTGLKVASVAWFMISGVISFAAGGYVAGRMSGTSCKEMACIHGIAAWALAAVFGITVGVVSGGTIIGSVAVAGAEVSMGNRASTSTNRSMQDIARPMMTAADGTDRVLTDAEIARNLETAREAAAEVALITGIAFLLATAAGGIGGVVGSYNQRRAATRDSTMLLGAVPVMG